ncbi:MAG: PH domain-containing protein, partial [Patescibacteria group bacterium]
AFSHLDENEKVSLVLRKHPFVLLGMALKGFLMLFFPPILYLAIYIFSPETLEFSEGSLAPYLAVLGASLYYLFLWLFLFIHWLEFYLDVWVVTNERVINVDQRRLFSRRVSEVRLVQVQDVTTEVEGFFHTFIKFGDIDLQTAAEQGKFTFKNIPNPDSVREVIVKLMEKHQSPGKT